MPWLAARPGHQEGRDCGSGLGGAMAAVIRGLHAAHPVIVIVAANERLDPTAVFLYIGASMPMAETWHCRGMGSNALIVSMQIKEVALWWTQRR